MDTNGSAPKPRRRGTAAPKPEGAMPARPSPARPQPPSSAHEAPTATPALAAAPEGSSKPPSANPVPPPHLVRDGVSIPEATLASLDLDRGAIGRLDAQDVDVTIGAIGAARAETIGVQLGTVGAALANDLRVSQGLAGTVLAGDARIDQAIVRMMVARSVTVERPSLIGFLLARRVTGDVRVIFDWRGALAFGAAFGLIARLRRPSR